MPEQIEVTRLRQAIEQFKGRMPRDLPAGVLEGLDGVEKQLGRVEPGRDSPGAQEAQKAASSDTGVHFSKAAQGPDQPSPGQREARKQAGDKTVSDEIKEAATQIAERVKGGNREGA